MLGKATTWVSCAAAASLLICSAPVRAAFHLVVIDQVFFGTADCPNAQYVMLRTLAPSQTFVKNQTLATQNADGSAAANFGTFASNLADSANGVAMLIGTADAQALFGIPMDQVVTGQLVLPDGRVCYGGGPYDCVAYGSFTGNNPGGGSPAPAPALGLALVRMSNGGNDADDFAVGAPAPENNAGQSGTLGTCGGAPPTPTATVPVGETPTATIPVGETPTPEPTPIGGGACVGDCDGTREVTVGEIITGVNIVLGNAQLSACEAIDGSGTGTVRINDLISAVNNLLNGC